MFILTSLCLFADAAILYTLFRIAEELFHIDLPFLTYPAAMWLRVIFFLFHIPFGIGSMWKQFMDRRVSVRRIQRIMKEVPDENLNG